MHLDFEIITFKSKILSQSDSPFIPPRSVATGKEWVALLFLSSQTRPNTNVIRFEGTSPEDVQQRATEHLKRIYAEYLGDATPGTLNTHKVTIEVP